MMRRPLVFMAGTYHGARRYKLQFHLLADFSQSSGDVNEQIERAMRRYVSTLETLCLESPYNWFNFFDFWAQPPSLAHDTAPSKSTVASG
jgi:predicted LPLAT superfamily acyltransferase